MPVDLPERRSAELEPLFAVLGGTEAECAAIVEMGRRRASHKQREHAQRATALRAGTQERAEAARAAAAAAAHATAGTEMASLDRELDDLVRDLRTRAQTLVPTYVAAVTDRVRASCAHGVEP